MTDSYTGVSPADGARDARPFPKTVYLTLWFPLLSETFVFYEVEGLWKLGLPVSVYSLYGVRQRKLAEHMRRSDIPVRHLGIPALLPAAWAVLRRLLRQPRLTLAIHLAILRTRWRDPEMMLENFWACAAGFLLAERLREAGVQHVHAAWASGPATAAWVVKRLEGIPYSLTARATDVRPPDGFLAEKLADCSFARADSSFNVPHLASFLPKERRDRVHLVYNTCTLASSGKAAVPMAPPCNVIAIGRLIEKKGFHYLVKAAALLRERGLRFEVTIVGDGCQMRPLRRQVKALRLEDVFRFTGALPHDRIAGMLRRSDMLVMPSIVLEGSRKSDGLPTVIVEAMSMGVPVVSTDVASIGDVVLDGETGRLVPEKDPEALAEAMASLMRDRALALRMAAAAERLLAEKFSVENTLGRMRALFAGAGD